MKKLLPVLLVIACLAFLILPYLPKEQDSKSIRAETALNPSATASRPTEPTIPPQTQPPETEPDRPQPAPFSPYGSAGYVTETTIVISLLINDQDTCWGDWDQQMDSLRTSINTTAQWISTQCGSYGAAPRILSDWTEYPDLLYGAYFDQQLVREDGSMYWTQREYLMENIPTEQLMEKYNAQNVIFLFLYNTDYQNPVSPRSFTNTRSEYVDYEIVNLYARYSGYDTPPAAIAHEMLHCFGAYDLYYASEGIPQEYVDHCTAIGSQDIMYTVNDGAQIAVEFTELCAYYIGLTDHCSVVSEWGLTLSTYDLR